MHNRRLSIVEIIIACNKWRIISDNYTVNVCIQNCHNIQHKQVSLLFVERVARGRCFLPVAHNHDDTASTTLLSPGTSNEQEFQALVILLQFQLLFRIFIPYTTVLIC